MKVAVIGSGPLGLEMALELDELGAHVVWFSPNEKPGSTIESILNIHPEVPMDGTWLELTTELGRKLSHLDLDLNERPVLSQYFEKYFKPLREVASSKPMLKEAKVLRVQKRFLNPGESIEGRSRLLDLFRVVYRLDPEKTINKQVQENPEVFKKLGENVLKSLSEHMEMFEDFDIVIDGTGFYHNPKPAGPSHSYAVNEKFVASKADIFYGLEFQNSWKDLTDKSVAIIGTGLSSAYLTNQLLDQFDNGLKEIILITNEEAPFGKLKDENELGNQLQKRLGKEYDLWKDECEKTQKKIYDWRALPQHEKAKVPCPQIPEPRLKVLPGYNITSIDQLLDQEGIFLTAESPEFREGEKVPLCTLKADKVFCLTGYTTSGLGENELEPNEPGFYQLGAKEKNKRYALQESLPQVQSIKNNILSFFSRAE